MTLVAGTPLDAFRTSLDHLQRDAAAALAGAVDASAVEAARVEFAGAKSGRLKAAQKLLGGIDTADKPAAGRLFNEAKAAVAALLDAAQARLAGGEGLGGGCRAKTTCEECLMEGTHNFCG